MKRTIVMSLLVSLFLCSCYQEPVQEERTPETDISLESYYRSFEEEAAKRGLSINLEDYDLISRIAEIEENDIAGTCQFNSHSSNVVTIDLSFWNSASRDRREMVVFHELGHCVLYQGHREEENDENACLSIMNSGTTGCIVYYNEVNRDYYLDELFEYME